jgi:tetratricopeptide (TPR) repeat protein
MDARPQIGPDPIERAGEAIGRHDWHDALDVLRHEAAKRDLLPPELELLAQAAYGAGELESALTAWEQLHAAHATLGDRGAAARAAATVAIYLMMDTGLMAPVRGWVARAERLLDGADECDTHAWLAMVRTYERLMSGDMTRARRWADRAILLGDRHRAPAPAAIGRVAVARLLIFDGNVDEGLELLDEAAVSTVSGELDPMSVGIVYCELICAMQGLAQYDRASEWTEAMERWRHGQAFGGINGRCRVHRAEILRLRGSCGEAEEEALHACEELRPWMRREFGWPLTELGTIRLRRGELDGAEEALLAAHEHGWDPEPGLALLHLARGEVTTASALIRNAIESPLNVPSKERPPHDRLRLAPLLEAQAEIALAEGDTRSARRAADELAAIAEAFRSRALQASASLTLGRGALPEGDPTTAAPACEEALAAWGEVGAPYEMALARMALAAAHRSLGNEARSLLELRAAHAAFERIGARLKAQEAAAALGEHRLSDPPSPGDPPGGASVFRADGDTRSVVYDGRRVVLRDLKGMRYLGRLLAEPGREFHALDLEAGERGVPAGPAPPVDPSSPLKGEGDLGAMLDPEAKQAYRRRLREIEEDIEDATTMGDTERVALAEADRDYIVGELSRAFGLGGRARKLGSTSERARASVTRAVRYALARVGEHHPALAEHLENTVHTGTYCSYQPDPRVPIHWTV